MSDRSYTSNSESENDSEYNYISNYVIADEHPGRILSADSDLLLSVVQRRTTCGR